MLDRNSPDIVRFLHSFLHSSDFAGLAHHASAIVRNPVAIIDSAFNLLGWSHLESVPDQTWLERIQEGHWDYDFVAAVKRGTSELARPGAHSVIVTGLSPLRRRIDTFVLNGRLLGYSVVLELENPLEETDEELYLFVRDILTKAMAMERASHLHGGSGTDILLEDLLNMHFSNRVLFHERIKGSDFDRETEFQLFLLSLEHYAPRSGEREKLKHALARLLPGTWSAYDEDRIVVLIDRVDLLRQKANALSEFSDFLKENGLQAGQSTSFSDLFLLSGQRAQAARALEIIQNIRPDFLTPEGLILGDYEQVKVLDILRRLPEDERIDYCHSAILAAARYDAERHSEYLPTIFRYLGARCSVHEAAKSLFVHHNTVHYRMVKARELFGLDFSSEHRNVHYYLSCLILLYLRQN